MQTVTLGRTGLKVSVAALGSGGSSRLGLRRDPNEAKAADLVRAAIDLGVTIIDTSPAYGTESVVGAAVKGRRRGDIVLSSKAKPDRNGSPPDRPQFITPAELRESVERSLVNLKTDHIDVFHLHGVKPQFFDYCRDVLLPELIALRGRGKIRFLGLTENFGGDSTHRSARAAIATGAFDVLMLGLNLVNPSLKIEVLPAAQKAHIGVMCMYAVRGALAQRDTACKLVERLVRSGEVDPAAVNLKDPLGFLLADGIAESLTDAAYRFCRHTPGISVVMTGTGSLDHLKQNLTSIEGPPLPASALQRLDAAFGRVTSATADL